MLTLRVVGRMGRAPAEQIEARIDSRGGSIGRSEECTLVLPDPGRRLSREQARVRVETDRVLITCTGADGGLFLNGDEIPPGDSAPLQHGDAIVIAQYEIHADFDAPAGLAEDDRTRLVLRPARSGATRQGPSVPGPAAMPVAMPAAMPAAPAAAAPIARPPSAPGPAPAVAPRPVPAVPPRPGPTLVPKPVSGVMPTSEPSAVPTPEPPAVPTAASTPVSTPMPAPVLPPASADAPSGVPSRDDSAQARILLEALLDGLGLQALPTNPLAGAPAQQTLTPELARRIGELLGVAVQGTVDLLQAASALKRGAGVSVPMIAPSGNNPLEFSPDAQAALIHLLAPHTMRGFMAPVPAVRDACEVLLAHQAASAAGLRAAARALIGRFDPHVLETRLGQRSMLDATLPGARRARLWELFAGRYGEISGEARDDFQALFGDAFVRAYEEEIANRRTGPA